MVYFLIYYKSMLIFEREMDHSLEDLPEHGLEVLHDLRVHGDGPLLGDDRGDVVSLQEAGLTLQANSFLGMLNEPSIYSHLNHLDFLQKQFFYLCGCGNKT